MRRFRQAPTVLLFAGMVLAVGLPGPVHADEERAANPGARDRGWRRGVAQGRQRRSRRVDPLDHGAGAGTCRRDARHIARTVRTVRRSPPGRTPCCGNRKRGRTRRHGGNPDLHEPLGARRELAAMGARRGGARRSGTRWCCRWCVAASRRTGCPRRRSGSASASAARRPGSPSTRACSGCSASSAFRPSSWCPAVCRPAGAGDVRTMRPRPTTASLETSD